MTSPHTTFTLSPHTRLLSVSGADATDFLQAQLSRQVDDLSPDLSALAGWHDASGKVRAVFRVLRNAEAYLLAAPADLVDSLISTMRMFVLRAEVHIELTDLVCAGIIETSAGPHADTGTAAEIEGLPPLPEDVNAVARNATTVAVCFAPGCWHVFAAKNNLSVAEGSGEDLVIAAEIRAGLPQVDQTTTLKYIPQMLNLDKLDALDFEKGCYPGQEIIARTQHLGSVKRRAQLFTATSPSSADTPLAGTAIVNADGERIGDVLRAARDADGTCVLLAVVTLSAIDEAVYIETPEGRRLEHTELPFA